MEDKKNEDFFKNAGHRTIFHELINSEILPPAEKQTLRVIHEAGAMVGAGGESTSQVLTALTYCLIADLDKLRKLREELRTIMPDSNSPIPSLKQLEKLPYLVCKTILYASSNSIAKRWLTKECTDGVCQRRLEVRVENIE
jgi:cytochrome P450